jgi:DNA primase
MGLFPQPFLDDLRAQTDIVQVVQDYVPLKRAGASYKGLCPFHGEKTPSFIVNRERGFFHCFGCGAGGDVFKFIELKEQIPFPEVVRRLAQRIGMPVPESLAEGESAAAAVERESLLKVHEAAARYFQDQLAGPTGIDARQQLRQRGLSAETVQRLKIGYAPPVRDGLKRYLLKQGFEPALIARSGLVATREDGATVDRFRGRLMIPICRDSGAVVAFGGRAMLPDQQPKYLNSPETPIYVKSRTLYGLSLTRQEIRKAGYAVLVEGYFDFAQVLQGGVQTVVASCGTALTTQQCQLLRRYTSKVVLSYDPDAAGQGAAEKSSQLLVSEGFQVNVALLPPGDDPDGFIRRHGPRAYADRLRASKPWLEYLLDRRVAERDMSTDEGRRALLNDMLTVAARIPDAASRDQFADRLAHKARITEEVVRAEIRKAAVERRTSISQDAWASVREVKPAERGLVWALIHDTEAALRALASLEDADLAQLATRGVLEVARSLQEWDPEAVPTTLLSRLNTQEAALVEALAGGPASPAPAAACAEALRRLRYERERAELQQAIDEVAGQPGAESRIEGLWRRKQELQRRIAELAG